MLNTGTIADQLVLHAVGERLGIDLGLAFRRVGPSAFARDRASVLGRWRVWAELRREGFSWPRIVAVTNAHRSTCREGVQRLQAGQVPFKANGGTDFHQDRAHAVEVARGLGVELGRAFLRSRVGTLAQDPLSRRARAAVWFALRKEGWSFSRISLATGGSHSSVMVATKKLEHELLLANGKQEHVA